MSTRAEKKALIKKCKEIVPNAPTLMRLHRFVEMGFIDNELMEEIETAIVLSIIQVKEPILGLCSIHPMQKKVFVGAAWLEDGCIRIVFTLQRPETNSSEVASFDREFSGDTVGKVLSKLAFNGGKFISQYQHAVGDIMHNIQKKDPLPEKGVKVQVINDDMLYSDRLKSNSDLFIAPKIAGLWEFLHRKDKKD